jgi:hypothetical protein
VYSKTSSLRNTEKEYSNPAADNSEAGMCSLRAVLKMRGKLEERLESTPLRLIREITLPLPRTPGRQFKS